MNKKTAQTIIKSCALIAIVAVSFGMYYGFGDAVLFEKGIIRNLWISLPIVIGVIAIFAYFVVERIYKKKN